MKKYITLFSIIFSSLTLSAQVRIASNLATSALNSSVTRPVVVTSVNNTAPAYANNTFGSVSISSSVAASVTAAGLTNVINPISSRFGYYTAFYAQLITVNTYSGYYNNIPVGKYLPPYGEYYMRYPTIATKEFNQFRPHYVYFQNGKPGFLPYQNDRPANIYVEVGVTKPAKLQVDPSSQSYPLNNTRFIKSFTLTY